MEQKTSNERNVELRESLSQLNKERLENLLEERDEKLSKEFELSYQRYLSKGTVSKNDQRNIRNFDRSRSSFDKIYYRLEEVEKILTSKPTDDLHKKKLALENCRGENNKIQDLLKNEYKEMNQAGFAERYQNKIKAYSTEMER